MTESLEDLEETDGRAAFSLFSEPKRDDPMKCKVFSARTHEALEEGINTWLETHPVTPKKMRFEYSAVCLEDPTAHIIEYTLVMFYAPRHVSFMSRHPSTLARKDADEPGDEPTRTYLGLGSKWLGSCRERIFLWDAQAGMC